MIKSKKLKAGARIAVLSPASTPVESKVRLGLERLQSLGYVPVLMPSAMVAGPLYYAGDAAARAADLHAAFADATIDGVLCTRGGWGTAELLPLLDADLIRSHPKPFLGFSDPTTLHLWFMRRPAACTRFMRPWCRRTLPVARCWRTASICGHGGTRWSVRTRGRSASAMACACYAAREPSRAHWSADALRCWWSRWGRRTRCSRLPGDLVLFVEEVNTRPYQWDRMMLHLRYAGVLDRVRGVVVRRYGAVRRQRHRERADGAGTCCTACRTFAGSGCDRAAVRSCERAERDAAAGCARAA